MAMAQSGHQRGLGGSQPHPAAAFLVNGPFPAFVRGTAAPALAVSAAADTAGDRSGAGAQRNLEPRSREGRRALVDKEALEKQRLMERTGGFHKYEFTPSSMLTSMGEGTPGFQPEARRFDTDSAAEEQQMRMQRVDRHNRIIEEKRAVNISREEEHWRRQEAERRAEEERQRQLREHSMKAKSNTNSMPYDPISLHYKDGKDGERLRREDEATRYKAALRAKMLQDHTMSAPYNPVTGREVHTVSVPEPPSGLQGHHGHR